MNTHSRLSSRSPKWALEQGKAVRQTVANLGAQIQKLDNQTGDTNPEIGEVEFSQQSFQSDSLSGSYSGSASIVDGKLDSLALSAPGERRVVGFDASSASNGNIYSWAPVTGGSIMHVQDEDGTTRVVHTKLVDPNTASERIKHSLGNVKDVALQAIGATIPVIGAGIVSLSNMFNDTNQGYQMTSVLGNLGGTAALVVGGLVSSPALLGLGGIALVTAGISAGLQTAKEAPSNYSEPYQESVTFRYPAETRA
jgi:hypothetical protein